MARTLIRAPKQARPGEVIEIRVLIQHPMESGQRRDARGALVPRMIINRFTCTYGGEEVISAELHPAIAANPYLVFHAVARESGPITLAWTDDSGATGLEVVDLAVA